MHICLNVLQILFLYIFCYHVKIKTFMTPICPLAHLSFCLSIPVTLEMVSLDISAHLAATDVNKNKALRGARLTT